MRSTLGSGVGQCDGLVAAMAARRRTASVSDRHVWRLPADRYDRLTGGHTCTYGKPEPPYALAWLHKVKVRAPMVTAVDADPTVRDHRKTSWQWKLQA